MIEGGDPSPLGPPLASPCQCVTTVVVRTPRRGEEDAYGEFLVDVARAAQACPGHLGVTVLRPATGQRAVTLLFRFDTLEHLALWTGSRERSRWAARANALCECEAEVHGTFGVDAWFTLAGTSAGARTRVRMATLAWASAFPTVLALNETLVPHLAWLPSLVRTGLVAAFMIGLMTFAWMPLLTTYFASWLARP